MPKYTQRFRKQWLQKEICKDWIAEDPNDETNAFCKYCRSSFKAKIFDIQKHAQSKKHLGNSEQFSSSPQMKIDFPKQISLGGHGGGREDRETKVHWGHEDVLRLISYVAEHWHHFSNGMRKKKFIWKDIAAKVSTHEFVVSGDDCDRKWRNLKIRYMAVLEKQMLGERTSHRIDYFESMHAFLKDDPDTQSRDIKRPVHDQMFKAVAKKLETGEFSDIVTDGAMEWNDSSVKMLLDLLLEFKDWFTDREEDRDDSTIWECLSEQMKIEGYEGGPEQCKRKWANLAQGFQYHKAAAEATGTLPLWPFYTRVRHVMQTIGKPLLALSNMMTSSTTKRQLKVGRITPKKKKPRLIKQEPEQIMEEIEDPVELPEMSEQSTWHEEPNEQSPSSTHNIMNNTDLREICLRLERVEEHLSVTRRLDHLEAQLNNMEQQQEAQQGVNVLLTQVLSELSRLSRTLMNRHGNTQDSTDLSSGITIVVPHSQHLE